MKKILWVITIMFICAGLATAQSTLEETTNNRTERRSRESTAPAVPSGAIMAFDLNGRCPSGWSTWKKGAGRVIIGSGKLDGVKYNNQETGGEAKAFISANNIKKGMVEMTGLSMKVKENQTPPYVMGADTSVAIKECVDRDKHCPRYPPRPYTVEMGSDNADPFDNRQPYIAMTYCKKN